MIKKNSIKKTSIYKGLSLAFAGVFAASLIPINVIETKADYMMNGAVGSEAIYVQNTVNKVNKGGRYEIRAAYFGSDAQIPVGLSDYAGYLVSYDGTNTIEAIESKVEVTYVSTGEKVATTKKEDSVIKAAAKNEAVWGTFEVASAGEYKVTYSMSVTVSGEKKTFETSTIVYSEVSSAYFEFDENSEKVIPSVYDVKMQSTLKNISLPLPKVFGKNEKEIEGVTFIANGDTTGVTDKYVDISISGGSETKNAVVDVDNGNFYIDAKYLNPEDASFAGEGNYTVKYAYYEGGQFIKSITKTFSVSKEYYKDYKLALSQNGSLSTAITGVEATLPTLIGKTDSKTTPANENVNIHYTVKAYRQNGSSYSEEKAESIKDGKFTPWADGNYKIVYTANDFYGNTKELAFFIDGVKDTQKPVVKIYDASEKANYVDGDYAKGIKEYKDASVALKSKTGEKNIIVYAVGATDNVSSGIKHTRTIKASARTIEIKEYADYNLIFDFDETSFLATNKYIDSRLSTEEKANFKNWLKENKFLIVTNDKTKTVEEGYAYIDATTTSDLMLKGDSSGRTYTIVYSAEDAAGNASTQLSYSMSVMSGEFEDTVAPEVTFVSNLKNSYRTNSTISFEAPSASDDADTRMNVVTEYKYNTESTWRTFEDKKYTIDLSEVEELIAAGETPTSLTIRAYAVDDYGNRGEWSKDIAIVDVKDTRVPTIISEVYNTPNTSVIEQNTEIVLPTIKLKDDNVNYLNAEVYVNRVDGDKTTAISVYGKNEVKNTLLGVYTLQAGKVVASYPGKYQVKVVITDAGNNQITTFYNYEVEGKVIVEDPVITGIGTTLGSSGVGEVGEAVDLGTPAIDFTINNETHGVFGVKDDDSKSAFNYNIKVVNDAPSAYKFNENEENTFTAYETGYYKLQYFVKLSVYNKTLFEVNEAGTAVVEKSTSNAVYPLANGDFMIVGETTVKYAKNVEDKYLVYDLSSNFEHDAIGIKVSGTKYYLDLADKVELVAPNGQKANFAVDADSNTITINTTDVVVSPSRLEMDDYIAYNLTSQVLTLEVKDTKAPVMLTEYNYPTTANVNDVIQIQKVEAKDASAKGIDLAKSYVIVSIKGGNTSYSKQYYLNKWTEESDYDAATGNIKYKVTNDGNCTITYYIYDHAGNVNSEKSYKIAVGDCEPPTVTVAKNIVKEKYSLSEFSETNPLVLDFSKISFSDKKTGEAALKETIKVVLKNTTTGKEVENKGDAAANIYRFVPTEVGTYEISISVTDEAGWTTTNTDTTFEISEKAEKGTEVFEVVGKVLIVVAVAILTAVVTYFVVSAVKRNKKAKGKVKKTDKTEKSDK